MAFYFVETYVYLHWGGMEMIAEIQMGSWPEWATMVISVFALVLGIFHFRYSPHPQVKIYLTEVVDYMDKGKEDYSTKALQIRLLNYGRTSAIATFSGFQTQKNTWHIWNNLINSSSSGVTASKWCGQGVYETVKPGEVSNLLEIKVADLMNAEKILGPCLKFENCDMGRWVKINVRIKYDVLNKRHGCFAKITLDLPAETLKKEEKNVIKDN